jgi:16S rRNA (uracil1498-N3)-methyltransferase
VRIFVSPAQLAKGELALTGDEHYYLARVRRARGGEIVELVDGAGRRARAEIARIADAVTTLVVDEPEAIAALPPVVRALLPLIKGDRMDGAIEKLVEVGADVVIVWPAARSVVKLDDARRDARLAHYQGIAQAAARQSGRAAVPAIAWAGTLAAAIAQTPPAGRLVLDPATDRGLAVAPETRDVAIASGPEGGLAPDELGQLIAAGFAPAGLGPRVLRADTAPIAAVAIIRAQTAT